MSVRQKLKKKPPHSGSVQQKGGATVDELEEIANVLSSQADVFCEKHIDVTSTGTVAHSLSDADEAVVLSPTPDPNDFGKDQSSHIRSKSLVPKSQVAARSFSTTPSLSPSSSSGMDFSSSSSSSERTRSKTCTLAKVNDRVLSTKSNGSERDVIDLCISTDDSTREQEEAPAFDEDIVIKSKICLPKLLNSNVLPTSEPTNLAFPGQSWDLKEEIAVSEPALPYHEEDPKSSSDYAKTPPIQPFDTTSMTPPIPRQSCNSYVDDWDKSLILPEAPSRGGAISSQVKNSSSTALEPDTVDGKRSDVPPNPRKADESSAFSPNPHRLTLPCKSHPAPSKKPPDERKVSRKEIRILQTRSKDPNLPSKPARKRHLSVQRPGKSKKTRVSQNNQQYVIVVDCVKKCIQEVNSKLERSRFKVLCKTVSKRLLGSWSERSSPRQRSIEKWLKHRHIKIVRLVEKYLEKNII